MKEYVFLSIGSNLGDRAQQLLDAERWIAQEIGIIIARSSVYETAPWGVTHQPNFYNRVLQIATELSPEVLLTMALGIEQRMGRIRTIKMGARTIDIDILFYGDSIVCTKDLQIPHPHIAARKFVLIPLVEIAPHFEHPLLQQPVHCLLDACSDTLEVKKVASFDKE